MAINRISKNIDYKILGYDINGKLSVIINDSGFRNLTEIIEATKRKAAGWIKPITKIIITNLDNDIYYTYRRSGNSNNFKKC